MLAAGRSQRSTLMLALAKMARPGDRLGARGNSWIWAGRSDVAHQVRRGLMFQ